MSCVFCDIIDIIAAAESFVVASDPDAVAFLDINPLGPVEG